MTNYVVPPLMMPDSEDLPMWYFQPLIAPTPIDTRLPKLDTDADLAYGFVTVEAAPASRVGLAQWDISFILHAYSPKEIEAADLSRTIMAYGTAVQGLTVGGWYIVGLVNAIGGEKLPNPDIELPRYRSALTWRVQGHPI